MQFSAENFTCWGSEGVNVLSAAQGHNHQGYISLKKKKKKKANKVFAECSHEQNIGFSLGISVADILIDKKSNALVFYIHFYEV